MNTEVFKYLPHGVSGSQWVFRWENLEPTVIVLGLYINHQLVGLVSFIRQPGFNMIVNLEVLAEQQGQGYGAKLLAIVMIDSFNQPDNEGYVSLTTKTTDVQHLYTHLGGEIHYRKVTFHTWTSQRIIQKYLPNGGNIIW